MNRPKSASDALPLAKQDDQPMSDPLSSPTKGILLTPGASAARKKNVTFGEHVVDNEGKVPLKSGLPDDFPGKFPSPGTKPSDESKKRDESPEKGRGRSKLTEAFEQARDESRKRKSKADKRGKRELDEDGDHNGEFNDPRSESGKYWKREYDIYRTNTQREVKKLITKQKAAKSFAQAKDTQCTELADQLKQEQKKAESLEAKTTELTSQMKELQDKLRSRQEAERRHRDEIATLKRQLGQKDCARPGSSDSAVVVPIESRQPEQRAPRDLQTAREDKVQKPSEPDKAQIETLQAKASVVQRSPELPKSSSNLDTSKPDPVQRPSEPYNPSAASERPRLERPTLRARTKSKPEDLQLKPSDDIWAQLDSSRSVVCRTAERPPASPAAGRAVTSGTDATPLRTLSVNTCSSGRNSERSSPKSVDVECKSQRDPERKDSKNSPEIHDKQNESSLISPALPQPSPDVPSAAKSAIPKRSKYRKGTEDKRIDLSIEAPPSSSFHSDAKASLRTAPAGPRAAPDLKSTTPSNTPSNTKENVSPSSKPNTQYNELKVKPSAVWSSINAPQPSNRSSSMKAKDGREVSNDRIEAARARIAARRDGS